MNLTEKYKNINKVIIVLFALIPIIPNRVKGIPVIAFVLISLYIFYKENKSIVISNRLKPYIIMSALFLMYMLTIFYTDNTASFHRKIETALSLIIIPSSFLINPSITSSNNIDFFKKVYLFSISVFSITFFTHLFFYENNYYPKGINDVLFVRGSIHFMPVLGTHPIYSSVFFGIGLIIIFNMYKQIKLYLLIPIFILLLTSIIMLASKMVIISLIIILIFGIIINISSKLHQFSLIVITITIFIISIIAIPSINSRFKEIFKSSTYAKVDKFNSTSIRNGINTCSLELIKQEWIFGYGIGDVQDELNNCYENTSKHLRKKEYNSHNQYLSILLGAGIFGLISFLLMLVYSIKLAWDSSDIFALVIILFYSTNFLTENLLERQSGVILFTFITNLLVWNNYSKVQVRY